MSLRAYSEINLHLTWHVKDNNPVIRDEIEQQLHRFLKGKAVQAPGVSVQGIGGTDDHIHLVVSVPPTLQLSVWIGELKGSSSHYINHEIANRQLLHWQGGYGVVRREKGTGYFLDAKNSQEAARPHFNPCFPAVFSSLKVACPLFGS